MQFDSRAQRLLSFAAAQRHDDGDPRKSIEQNQKRFGYSDDLKAILLNTVDFIENENG